MMMHGKIVILKLLIIADGGFMLCSYMYIVFPTAVHFNCTYVHLIQNICYVKINNDTKIIQTLENEEIEDNTIIEFAYNVDEEDIYKKWTPLRVRYDKTTELNVCPR